MEQQKDPKYDRERDPKVIEKRHKLFNELVLPSVRFIDYLCVKYCSDPKDIPEFKYNCLIHLFRTVESFDASRYKDIKNPKRAWQNWCHIVCKRFIQKLEFDRYKAESIKSEHECIDIDDSGIWDSDDAGLIDTENTDLVITMSNYRQLMGDRLLYAFEHLDIIQKESFLLQHKGLTIVEIHKDQVDKGRLSPNTGCDAIKKRMQRGRVILAKYLAEYDEFAKRKMVKKTQVSGPNNHSEDGLDLNF